MITLEAAACGAVQQCCVVLRGLPNTDTIEGKHDIRSTSQNNEIKCKKAASVYLFIETHWRTRNYWSSPSI